MYFHHCFFSIHHKWIQIFINHGFDIRVLLHVYQKDVLTYWDKLGLVFVGFLFDYWLLLLLFIRCILLQLFLNLFFHYTFDFCFVLFLVPDDAIFYLSIGECGQSSFMHIRLSFIFTFHLIRILCLDSINEIYYGQNIIMLRVFPNIIWFVFIFASSFTIMYLFGHVLNEFIYIFIFWINVF